MADDIETKETKPQEIKPQPQQEVDSEGPSSEAQIEKKKGFGFKTKATVFCLGVIGLVTSYSSLQSYGTKAYAPVQEAMRKTAKAVTENIVHTPKEALHFYVTTYAPNELASTCSNVLGSREEIYVVPSKAELVEAFSIIQAKGSEVSYREEKGPNSYSGASFVMATDDNRIVIDKTAFSELSNATKSSKFMAELIIAAKKIAANSYSSQGPDQEKAENAKTVKELRQQAPVVIKPVPLRSGPIKDKKSKFVKKIPVPTNANFKNQVRKAFTVYPCKL